MVDWTRPHAWTDREALAEYMPKHVEYIRSLVPPENLLEFHPRDGWEPLCKFIGKDVPDEPFPHVNKGNSTVHLVAAALTIRSLRIVLPYVAGIGVVAFAYRASGWMK